MAILNATDAKREFGEVLLKSQKEPVFINKNGKPVAVMVSAAEYEELSAIKEAWFKKELQLGLDDLKAGRVSEGNEVMERLRKRIADAAL